MDRIVFAGFDWDEGNLYKCQRHGLKILDVECLFTTEFFIASDKKHSSFEARLIACGMTSLGRGIFVAFTIREKEGGYFIRPISARYMHQRELIRYEKEIAKTKLG